MISFFKIGCKDTNFFAHAQELDKKNAKIPLQTFSKKYKLPDKSDRYVKKKIVVFKILYNLTYFNN